MAGIETLLVGAAQAIKAGEALNLANMAGKALGIGGKKDETVGGGSQGPDKSIEANRAGGRDEEMYLFLDALFGQLQTADLSNEITSEERRLFGKFLQALTPAEANLIVGGVAKRESDIHIKEPVMLKMRRRNKQGEEQEVDERSFKDFSVKTNARGRSIVRGVAHHIAEQVVASNATTEAAIVEAENEAITSLVTLLRHAQLVRNPEDMLITGLLSADEAMQRVENILHHICARMFTDKDEYQKIKRDPEVAAKATAIRDCQEQSQRVKLREEYQRLLIDKVLRSKEKRIEEKALHVPTSTIYDLTISRRSSSWLARSIGGFARILRAIRKKVTVGNLICWGTPIITIAFLILIGTR